jgi:hypothetical protein
MICHNNENGSVCVSTSVYTDIAGTAASNCFGVKGMAARSVTDGVYHLLRKESMGKGVRIQFHEDDTISIDLHIMVDNGLKAIIEAADKYGYTVLITADHGNADQMTETKKGKTSVRTAHSLNPVPFIIYDKDTQWTVKEGAYGLANVAPTVVKMMGLTAPACWEESMI